MLCTSVNELKPKNGHSLHLGAVEVVEASRAQLISERERLMRYVCDQHVCSEERLAQGEKSVDTTDGTMYTRMKDCDQDEDKDESGA